MSESATDPQIEYYNKQLINKLDGYLAEMEQLGSSDTPTEEKKNQCILMFKNIFEEILMCGLYPFLDIIDKFEDNDDTNSETFQEYAKYSQIEKLSIIKFLQIMIKADMLMLNENENLTKNQKLLEKIMNILY